MASMLGALAPHVEESLHPFLAKREVKVRGILLITTDKGLCGPLNANLFKLVSEVKTPAKFVAIGRKGAQFLARTKRDLLADFQVHDRVPFAEVKVAVEFLVNQFLEGTVDTVEVIYPRFKNTLIQEPTVRPVLPLASVAQFTAALTAEAGTTPKVDTREMRGRCWKHCSRSTLIALSTSSSSAQRRRSTAPAWSR
jgi:F-type H+-transporting ATPase subunit gamma